MAKRETLNTGSTIPIAPAKGTLQRKCAGCGNHTVAGGECEECKKNSGVLQTKLTVGAAADT